ncbi:transposase [Ruthenibacterium lactatiformans]|uniref:transposase n=1 Tax=Ruthenibacterium lactatiformans TaxID=1550024 RepID=UPI00397CE4BC
MFSFLPNGRKTPQKKDSAPRYDEAFKSRAVRIVTEQDYPSAAFSKELGICLNTLRSWLKATSVQTS